MFDDDPRGKAYRKYLMSLQVTSIALDWWFDIYSPILQMNCRIMFSNSRMAKIADVSSFFVCYIIFFRFVANSYFWCVYYRR
ncbi:hypothetical protein PFISCL1PPCAC_18688, partial [Pristionchus fissidentatus]